MDRRLDENRAWWDEMVALHADAPFYDREAVRAGASALDRIEQSEVGDVEHASLLHLQCHFGLSTLSLAAGGPRHRRRLLAGGDRAGAPPHDRVRRRRALRLL